jgi:phage terminase small subunit
MGLRGPLNEAGKIEILESRADRPVPPMPSDLHPQLQDEWRIYWNSDVAKAADEVDIPMVSRLFTYRDEWLRHRVAMATMPEDQRIVAGSRNADALRIHPFADRMTKLEGEISKLEDKLGLSPLSRARLGIEIGQQRLTWNQLAKAATGNGVIGSSPDLTGLPVVGGSRG